MKTTLVVPLLSSMLFLFGCTQTSEKIVTVPGGGSGGGTVCAMGQVANSSGTCEVATSAVIVQSDGTNSIVSDDMNTKAMFFVYSFPVGLGTKTFTATPVAGKKFVSWTGACAAQTTPVCTLNLGYSVVSIGATFAVDTGSTGGGTGGTADSRHILLTFSPVGQNNATAYKTLKISDGTSDGTVDVNVLLPADYGSPLANKSPVKFQQDMYMAGKATSLEIYFRLYKLTDAGVLTSNSTIEVIRDQFT